MKKEKQRGYKVERLSWVLGVVPCCWRRHIWGVPGVVVDSSILYSTLFSSLHVFCTFPPFSATFSFWCTSFCSSNALCISLYLSSEPMPTIVFTLCIANAFRIYTPVHVTLCSEDLEAEEIGKNIVRTELGKQGFGFLTCLAYSARILCSYA